MAARADIWRTRMDATTNWAIGATAAVLSFVLGDPDAPASAIAIAALLTLAFLMLEARRLTFYHLWQRRVLLLERVLVGPALSTSESAEGDARAAMQELRDRHVGRTIPEMPLLKAIARRFRRIYLYLLAVEFAAYVLKQTQVSADPLSLGEWWGRAGAGPGVWLLVAVSVGVGVSAAALWRMGGIDRGERA